MTDIQPQRGSHKRRERLRDSCNACAQAKVRCSREKPSCSRCITKSLSCDCSPSLRKGKRRTTGLSDSSSSSNSMGTSSSSSITTTFRDDVDADARKYQDQTLQSNALTPPLSNVHSKNSSPLLWDDRGWDGSATDGLAMFASPKLFTSPPKLFATPYSTPLPDINVHKSLASFSSNNFNVFGFDGGDGLNFDGSNANAFCQKNAFLGIDNDNITTITPPIPAPATRSSSANSSCPHLQDCMGRALDMLRQLSVPETTPKHTDSTPEKILARNKTIVDSIHGIIRCVRMKEMQMMHTLSILTIKLISSYKATLSDVAHLGESASCSGGLDEARIRMQTVLTELGRVHALVDALSDRLRRYGQLLDSEIEMARPGRMERIDGDMVKHSSLLEDLERVIRLKERGIVEAVARGVRY